MHEPSEGFRMYYPVPVALEFCAGTVVRHIQRGIPAFCILGQKGVLREGVAFPFVYKINKIHNLSFPLRAKSFAFFCYFGFSVGQIENPGANRVKAAVFYGE